MELDTQTAIRRQAMDLLARREHGSRELARKLEQRGADPQLVVQVLAKLADEGLLSDERYLESLVRRRVSGGYGPLRIRDELTRQGASREAVEQVFQQLGVDWADLLEQVWLRRFAGQHPDSPKAWGQQARFLAYRGFPAEMIRRLLQQRRR